MQQTRVTVGYKGRTGNRITQHCAARLFAERNSFHFTETVTSLWPFRTDGHTDPQQPYVTLTDRDDIMALHAAPGVNYHLDGWFQRAAYYMPERERIREWFRPVLSPVDPAPDDDVVMHLRLDDYRHWPGYSRVLDPSWYLGCLSGLKFNKLHIVAEQLDENYLHAFRHFEPVIVHHDAPLDDWNYLRRFRLMVMSNSTFAWWAWFLGLGRLAFTFRRWVDDKQIQLTEWPGALIAVDGEFQRDRVR